MPMLVSEQLHLLIRWMLREMQELLALYMVLHQQQNMLTLLKIIKLMNNIAREFFNGQRTGNWDGYIKQLDKRDQFNIKYPEKGIDDDQLEKSIEKRQEVFRQITLVFTIKCTNDSAI